MKCGTIRSIYSVVLYNFFQMEIKPLGKRLLSFLASPQINCLEFYLLGRLPYSTIFCMSKAVFIITLENVRILPVS